MSTSLVVVALGTWTLGCLFRWGLRILDERRLAWNWMPRGFAGSPRREDLGMKKSLRAFITWEELCMPRSRPSKEKTKKYSSRYLPFLLTISRPARPKYGTWLDWLECTFTIVLNRLAGLFLIILDYMAKSIACLEVFQNSFATLSMRSVDRGLFTIESIGRCSCHTMVCLKNGRLDLLKRYFTVYLSPDWQKSIWHDHRS
ncbi:hypothetical protein BKA64DRAFT_143688 [Cadophora sp. MPI-SDFR-AT-0126]|nr:hypothetical protein BKA64DRAFT_143688 [Leotiomycetes sp. MPI-SDFR-AT-0126]